MKSIIARYPFQFVALGLMALALVLAPASTVRAQTPAPATPANLEVSLTDTEGEVRLTWNEADGATQYRACARVQDLAGSWTCKTSSSTTISFTGLTVGAVYDFAVASFDGRTYSGWVWETAAIFPVEADICPITGLPMPEGGYKSLGDATTADNQSFTLDEVTFPEHTRMLEADLTVYPPGTSPPSYFPPTGRKWAKTCGEHTNHGTKNINWAAGYDQNLSTDAGISFVFSQQASFLGSLYSTKPDETRTVCQLWHIPDDAETLIVAVGLDVTSVSSYHLYSVDVE